MLVPRKNNRLEVFKANLSYKWEHFKYYVATNKFKVFMTLVAIILLYLAYTKTHFYLHFSFGTPVKGMSNKNNEFKVSTDSTLLIGNPGNPIGNGLTDSEKRLAEKLNVTNFDNEDKIAASIAYIEKYKDLALSIQREHNIPASITLAQGIIESNAGRSALAKLENNHFGIKCKAKCYKCRCANYADDDKWDMFRIFNSPEESYEERTRLLKGDRYKHLLKLNVKDYKSWAYGLKKAGYATDKYYAEKLIKIVERFKLHEL
jgi:uncharacterized FlgJ-related protein